jgi:hypothetical protein
MSWHTRSFSTFLLYLAAHPSILEKIIDSRRLVVCVYFNSEGRKVTIATVGCMSATKNYELRLFKNGVTSSWSKLKTL